MPAFTVSGLLTRFRTVLEASPLSLSESRDAFSHDRQPNGLLTNVYYVEDAGLLQHRQVTNYDAVRIDRFVVYVTRHLAFDGSTAMNTLEDTLNTINKEIIEDGVAQGYNPNIDGRRMTRPEGKDYCVGSISFAVDYDTDET